MTTLNQFLKHIFKTKVEQLGSKYFFKNIIKQAIQLDSWTVCSCIFYVKWNVGRITPDFLIYGNTAVSSFLDKWIIDINLPSLINNRRNYDQSFFFLVTSL